MENPQRLAASISNTVPALIPIPVRMTPAAECGFVLRPDCKVTAGHGAAIPIGRRLVELIRDITGMQIAPPTAGNQGDIVLELGSQKIPGCDEAWQADEAYRLQVSAAGIRVSAAGEHGLSNGIHTLSQLLSPGAGSWHLPACTIEDHPRFAWRGLMLDCARHFFSVQEICRLLDLMALHKFNRLHWHLTEDQGWRIEVKKYPRLTEVGAWRSQSPKMGDANSGDATPYGGFYTQQDVRRVVAYAASRFITIVPEIEMPGHSTAAIAAYPWLGNQDIPGWTDPAVADRWGVHTMTLSPRQNTFSFIEDVLEELLPLFPGEYVHIGGDEAPKDQWKQSPAAQDILRSQELKDEHELQAWFLRRVESMLTARGKRLIGWDEIQEGGLSATATMMVWRKWDWATLALQRGNDIVMSPQSHTYFDYNQGVHPDTPEYQTIGQGTSWHRTLPVQTVSEFEPIPPGTPGPQQRQVLGCQGQLWSEYIWSYDKLEYMAFPRACALAEAAWSQPAIRGDFMARLQQHERLLERLGVNYRLADGTPSKRSAHMQRTPQPKP